MDVMTVVILLASIGLFAFRSTNSGSTEGKSTAQQEAALRTARPGLLRVRSALDSLTHEIDFRSDSATVVVLFTTTCPYCKQTKPEWERLAGLVSPSVRLIALTAEPQNPEIARYFASARIRALLPESLSQFMAMFPVEVVPVTIAVRSGRVLAARVGVAKTADMDHIIQVLSTTDGRSH